MEMNIHKVEVSLSFINEYIDVLVWCNSYYNMYTHDRSSMCLNGIHMLTCVVMRLCIYVGSIIIVGMRIGTLSIHYIKL